MIDIGGAGFTPSPGLIWEGVARYMLTNYEDSRPSIVLDPLVASYLNEKHLGWRYSFIDNSIGIYVSGGACPVDAHGDTKIIVDEMTVVPREFSHKVYQNTIPIYISCSTMTV